MANNFKLNQELAKLKGQFEKIAQASTNMKSLTDELADTHEKLKIAESKVKKLATEKNKLKKELDELKLLTIDFSEE